MEFFSEWLVTSIPVVSAEMELTSNTRERIVCIGKVSLAMKYASFAKPLNRIAKKNREKIL